MRCVIKFIVSVILISLCIACSSKVAPTNVNSLPYWFNTPSSKGYTGGVGICGTHVNGKAAQRQLAITRALEDIARQYGVRIDNTLSVSSSANQNSATVNIDTYSIHTIEGKVVIAKIIEVWENKVTDELYVYMRSIQE